MNGMRTGGVRKLRRGGFSLIELTLVIAIMGILMGVAVIAFGPRLMQAKTRATEASLRVVAQEIDSYYVNNNTYPTTLNALVPNYLKSLPMDGWKRPFYYRVPGAHGKPYDLISFGEDGQPDTADDISVWDLDKER